MKDQEFIFTTNHTCGFYHLPFMNDFDVASKLKMMEIGCQEGRVSMQLIKLFLRHAESEMYCLDLWEHFDDGKWANGKMEKNFDSNVRALQEHGVDKVIKIKGPSWKSLRKLNDENDYESFDLIYIDGWHGSHSVLDDAVLSWKLLKVGGVLVFDDYSWSVPSTKPFRNPKLAIDSFWEIFHIFAEKIFSNANQIAFKKTVANDMEIEICQKLESL